MKDASIVVRVRVLLMVCVLIGLTGLFAVPTVGTSGNTPTYVLGVSDPLDPMVVKLQSLTSSLTTLPAVSDISLVGGGSILFVDGAWLESVSSLDPNVLSLVLGKVLEGIPAVVVRGNPALVADSVSGLVRWRAEGLPLIAEGVKIRATLSDGTRVGDTLQVLGGFDYAVETEFRWAEQRVSEASTLSLSSTDITETKYSPMLSASEFSAEQVEAGPFWLFLGSLSVDSGDFFAPVARSISTVSVFRLENDGSDDFRWFNFFMNQTSQPGIEIYKSDFATTLEEDRVRPRSSSNMLVDHGPRGRVVEGGKTLSYNIGVAEGTIGAMVTLSQAQSFFLKQVTIEDLSLDSEVAWVFDFNARTDSGKLTYSIIPGWTVRVRQDGQLGIEGVFVSSFDRLKGDMVLETASVVTTLIASGG